MICHHIDSGMISSDKSSQMSFVTRRAWASHIEYQVSPAHETGFYSRRYYVFYCLIIKLFLQYIVMCSCFAVPREVFSLGIHVLHDERQCFSKRVQCKEVKLLGRNENSHGLLLLEMTDTKKGNLKILFVGKSDIFCIPCKPKVCKFPKAAWMWIISKDMYCCHPYHF